MGWSDISLLISVVTLLKPAQMEITSQTPKHQVIGDLMSGDRHSDSTSHISTMAGSSASLPCNLTSSVPGDSVRLVLWFKGMEEKPIYTLDARDKTLEEARHWSDDKVLEGRAFFRSSLSPGRLMIDSVKLYDDGTYKCRVDFKIQPTTISHVNLTVNTPPEKPTIYDDTGKEVRLKLGPYQIGESVMIKCLVLGGQPSPAVTWWRDHQIVDDSFDQTSQFKVTNLLTIPALRRSDLHSILTCQAKNNNESVPVSTSVKLDMTFGPETVRIVGLNYPMSAGQRYNIQCEAVGSRPVPTITWWIGDTQVNVLQTQLETSSDNNVTTSTISLLASAEQAGKTLTCKAAIPNLVNSGVETTQTLNIQYISAAKLSLGSSMEISHVKRGDDIYLECGVQANPRPHKVIWEKDGVPIKQDVSGGIILSNLTLVLQRIAPSGSGNYKCKAYNKEGSVTSNSLPLHIKYEPICAQGQEASYRVPLNKRAEIVCQVMSDPDNDLTFHWLFNTSREIIDIQQSQTRVNGTRSIVDYIPRTDMDYGSLLCWAENSVGKQTEPCVFQLLPANRPGPVKNCSISDIGIASFEVDCIAGNDGGLNQTFFLEIRHLETGIIVANQTSEMPKFSVIGLQPNQEVNLTVHSFNTVGPSEKVTLKAMTSENEFAQRHIDQAQTGSLRTKLIITPILGALIGVGAALGLVTLTIVVVMCCRTKQDNSNTHSEYQLDKPGMEKDHLSPDVIPSIMGNTDDESGFELYQDKNFSTLNNRSGSLRPSQQTRHKNVFIVGPQNSCATSCCGAGNCTTPTSMGPYNTLQYKRTGMPHRDINYSPLTHKGCMYDNCNSLRPVVAPKRLQFSENYASLRRATHNHGAMENVINDSKLECGPEMPLLASAYHQRSVLSSEVSSTDLNHSLTTSDDTSDISSERDRESEV